MYRELPCLPELHITAWMLAFEAFSARVDIQMIFEVRLKNKTFSTEMTHKFFVTPVNYHVPIEASFVCKYPPATCLKACPLFWMV